MQFYSCCNPCSLWPFQLSVSINCFWDRPEARYLPCSNETIRVPLCIVHMVKSWFQCRKMLKKVRLPLALSSPCRIWLC